jgi:hypothetical protein
VDSHDGHFGFCPVKSQLARKLLLSPNRSYVRFAELYPVCHSGSGEGCELCVDGTREKFFARHHDLAANTADANPLVTDERAQSDTSHPARLQAREDGFSGSRGAGRGGHRNAAGLPDDDAELILGWLLFVTSAE